MGVKKAALDVGTGGCAIGSLHAIFRFQNTWRTGVHPKKSRAMHGRGMQPDCHLKTVGNERREKEKRPRPWTAMSDSIQRRERRRPLQV